MNLRDLEYCVALADTRHFGRAAERCLVSPADAVGAAQEARGLLGVPLIERRPRQVGADRRGRGILQLARRMLRESRRDRSLARNEQDPLAGP